MKNLSMVAKELFPDLEQNTYDQLLHSYLTDGKTNINPKLSLDEAVQKYTPGIIEFIENKANWKHRGISIFLDFPKPEVVFEEFFPVYRAENNTPYLDLAEYNDGVGEKIVCVLVTEIFYRNYTGMEICDISFTYEDFAIFNSIIRISLRLSEGR
jgi:hypothetical protein